jgi:hypothetical protein
VWPCPLHLDDAIRHTVSGSMARCLLIRCRAAPYTAAPRMKRIRDSAMRKPRYMDRRNHKLAVPKRKTVAAHGEKTRATARLSTGAATDSRLPHEKDETTHQPPAKPDAIAERAYRDLTEGQVDTDCRNAVAHTHWK